MKKSNITLPLLIAAVMIAGCKGKEGPQEESQSQTIAFYVGDSAMIDTYDGKAVNYISEKEFVASAENDIAIAQHVGNTHLISENKLYKADVTVLPRYRFFQEPVTQWGIDTTTLMESLAPLKPVRPFGLDSAGVRTIYGYLRMPNVEATLYYFEDNKLILTWSLIPQKDSVLTHMQDFLDERYEYMNSQVEKSYWNDALVHRYMDAYSTMSANLIVAYHDMTLNESADMIEGMFGTRNLLGLVYQDAHLHQFDTTWINNYITGLPSRLMNGGK